MARDLSSRTPLDALDRNDPAALTDFLEWAHPVDLAAYLEELDLPEVQAALLDQPLDRRAETFGYLPIELQVALARALDRSNLARIVTEMNSDERADLFNRLDPDQQDALLPGLAQAEREDIRRLASHEEGTAGAIMTSDYATLAPELTTREAIEVLRREAPDKETIYRAYVVDPQRRLVGAVRLQDLILANPATRIETLMDDEPIAVHVTDDQESVARKIARYDILALPVLDDQGTLVGIVTHDDALDALQEEATEDFERVGAVGPIGESLRDASIKLLYQRRVGWLVLLVFANIFSGAGIAYFEDTIAAHLALLFFLPLLIAAGGNAGSQASTLMVRALATGDVVPRDWFSMLGRELVVAGALGVTMAVAVAGIGVFRGGVDIAIVVALTMVTVVLLSSLIGMSMPFILRLAGMDPATASAPLIATMADAMGVLIYFGIATLVLLG